MYLRLLVALLVVALLTSGVYVAALRFATPSGGASIAEIAPSGGMAQLGAVTLSFSKGGLAHTSTVRLLGVPTHAVSPLPTTIALPGGTTVTSPVRWVFRPVHLVLSGPLLRPVGLQFHLARHLAEPLVLLTSTNGSTWTPVAARYDKGTGVLSASTGHLSFWGVVGVTANGIASVAQGLLSTMLGPLPTPVNLPSCQHLPAGLSVTQVLGQSAGFQYCFGALINGQLHMEISNTSAYPIDVEVPTGSHVTVAHQAGPLEALGAALHNAITRMDGPTGDLFLVPGDTTAELVMPISPTSPVAVLTRFDTAAFLFNILSFGLDEVAALDGSATGASAASVLAHLSAELNVASCVADAQRAIGGALTAPTLSLSSIPPLAKAGFECLSSIPALAGALAPVADAALGTAALRIAVGGIQGAYDTLTANAHHVIAITERATLAAVNLPVISCPTSDSGIGQLVQPPAEVATTIPTALQGKLAAYGAAYYAGLPGLVALAPGNLPCSAYFGGDGSGGLDVGNTAAAGTANGGTAEGVPGAVLFYETTATTSIFADTCGIFPASVLIHGLGVPGLPCGTAIPTQLPQGATEVSSSSQTTAKMVWASFTLQPGVCLSGLWCAPPQESLQVLTMVGPQSAQPVLLLTLECAFPSGQQDLCQAVVDAAASRYAGVQLP